MMHFHRGEMQNDGSYEQLVCIEGHPFPWRYDEPYIVDSHGVRILWQDDGEMFAGGIIDMVLEVVNGYIADAFA